MRFITTPSYYSYYFAAVGAIIVALLLPAVTQAARIIPEDGCFLRDTTTIYLTEPTCQLNLENDLTVPETLTVQLFNLDPDGVEFTGATTTIASRTKNTLTADITVPVGTTLYTITPWYNVGDDFYFVATSDNQARGTVETNPIFEELFSQISVINPIFFTNSGDLVQGSDSTETLRDMFTAVQNTITEASVPMYPVPGNHDYDTDLETYSDFFGPPDYSYDVGPVHFIGLSTSGNSSKGMVSAEQFSWIESEFDQSSQLYKVIYFHHPLSVPAWGKPECCFADNTNRDALADLLDQKRVDFIINGHSQGYDYRYLTEVDLTTLQLGFYQLITGGAGGNIAQPNGDYHYTLTHVTDHGIEHQVINESDFGLALEYDNNNGRKTRAEATIENSSDIDIPYLRLKFRLRTSATSFLIQDETGQYYPNYQSHAYPDYTVIYVETSLPANTTHTVSITPANVIHTNLTQTIDAAGNITYSAAPTSFTTATSLKVKPATLTTTLTAVNATPQVLSWIETPDATDLATTYTLTDLSPNTFVQIAVNGRIFQRLVADAKGKIVFTYTAPIAERSFVVRIFPEPPQTVVTLPASDGTAQVRLFSKRGEVLGQWQAFDGTVVTDPQIWRANLMASKEDEVIIYEPKHTPDNLRIYSLAGNELQRVTLNTTTQNTPWVGDITGDQIAEVMYLLPLQSHLIMSSFESTVAYPGTQGLDLPASLSSKISLVALTDVTQDGIADIVIFDQQQRRLVALSYRDNNLHIVRSYRLNRAGRIVAVAAGYFQQSDQLALAVLHQQPSGRQSLWQLVPDGARAWKRQFRRTYPTAVLADVQAITLRPNQTDRLVATTFTGQLMTYRVAPAGWKKVSKIALDSNGMTSPYWQIGLLNGGARWPMRLVVTEITTPGRVTVWQTQSTQPHLTSLASWYAYGESFSGGTLFAGND